MAQRYAAADGVAAVLLAGSVARGLADARSDVEVDVYWQRAPSDAERRAVVDDAGWEWVYAEVDEHEWADGVRLDGVKVDVSQFVTATIDGYLDALREGDTEPELQVRATALLDGRALAGDEPDRGLAGPAGAVPRGARPGDARPGAAAAARRAARDAGRARRPRAADARRGRGRARPCSTRCSPSTAGTCRTRSTSGSPSSARQLPLAPPDLEARIRRVLAVPREGVPDLVRLTEETFDLVEAHVPAYDVAAARAEFGSSLRG